MPANKLAAVYPLTAGLNKPPLILKNTQAFTASENPNARDI